MGRHFTCKREGEKNQSTAWLNWSGMRLRYPPMLAQFSGLQSLRMPPLQPLTSRGRRGEERVPREWMVLPWGWALSTAWGRDVVGGRRGRGRDLDHLEFSIILRHVSLR